MGHDPSFDQTTPSAPPLLQVPMPQQQQSGGGVPQSVPPGYPPIVSPGVPVVMHTTQQQQQQQQQQQPYAGVVQHPSSLPQFRPPPVHVVEQHTYVHLPGGQEEPLITRSSAARPRQITCPACFQSGPTSVERVSGCCAYLACFGLCWVCCPLFWLPFCLDCDKDTVHRCSSCGQEVYRVAPCS